ncbi:MAG TPA: DUF4350 domain-containing protein [Pirellulales bacterium]|jgi:hypothetical protein|nr:DUF4350 domain-containing protein [Pirellulales bacterium]
MLSARTVIIFVVLLVTVSVVGTVVSMLQTPDSDGLAADTYGTRAHGYRAIYDILAALQVTDERALRPPGGGLDRSATLVLWAPQDDLVSDEPVYLQQVARWVREGGRVVVGIGKSEVFARACKSCAAGICRERTSAAEVLGIEGVKTRRVDLAPPVSSSGDQASSSGDHDAPVESKGSGSGTDKSDESSNEEDLDEEDFANLLIPQLFVPRRVEVRGEGSLSSVVPPNAHMDVPESFQALDVGKSEPTGRISVITGQRPLVLAAQYKLGTGEVILVSEPRIFDNRLISHFDNSVLAVRLLAGGGGPVVWDEFYHGLTIRGSILFLLTRGAYALVAVMISVVLGVWLWRQARFLGPPRVVLPPSRRTVREYVEAMARFFRRGSESRRFMLAEVRRGVLWTLRHRIGIRPEFGLRSPNCGAETQPSGAETQSSGTGQRPIRPVQRPTGTDQETLEALIAALSRQDPAAARQLREAMDRADRIVLHGESIGEREVLEAVKGLADCL